MYIFVLIFFFLSMAYNWLTNSLFLLHTIQESLFVQQPVVGPATRRFCWAFIAWVSVRVSRS
jgi:hypothetical protein